MDEKENPKKIEVVSGDGELNISPVYEHLEVEKPKHKDPNKKIFIPEVKKTSKTTESKEQNSDV